LKDKNEIIISIQKELKLRNNYLKNKTLKTIYFGGGTPSILNKNDIISILNEIKKYYKLNEKTEITIECNPDDLSYEKLLFYYEIGINRLSIGVQTFNDGFLKFMNRSHKSYQSIESIKMAKEIGFKNISIDLIFSLPNQTIMQLEKDLIQCFSLKIQHLSIYSLTIEEKTKLSRMINKNELNELPDDISSKQFKKIMNECKKNNYIQYEISNFGMDGFFSEHNSNYWMRREYLGIGPSAHSYNGNSRRWNISNNKVYIEKICNNKKYFSEENLNLSQRHNEYIMTSLRTMWGINLKYFKKEFGLKYYIELKKNIDKWIYTKDISIHDDYVLLTNKGKYISDSICSDLFNIPN
tara:strand:+ start:23509 stop:24567 length:1059 start_codon:yes stop_codon:yes gene_type:complete